MKKFEIPRMKIQFLASEEIMGASDCFEVHACIECYCTLVQCPVAYECSGLVCPTLSDYN